MVNVYDGSEENEPLFFREFLVPEAGYHLLKFGKEIQFESQDTIVFGIGFKSNDNQKYLPLVYVRSSEINRNFPTYFSSQENGKFSLIPYTYIGENCTYYIQAVLSP